MSDFLGRLAARTLGVASIAQPISRSMFAPGLDQAGERQEGFVEPASSTSRLDSETITLVSSLSSVPSAPAGDSRQRANSDFSVVDVRIAGRPDLKISDSQSETLLPSPNASHPSIRPFAGSESVRAAGKGSADEEGVRSASSQRQGQQGDAASPATHLLVPGANLQRDAFPVSSSPSRKSAERERNATSVDAAPVVRVSIGRVEVRAEFPATAPRTSSQRSPSLTLSLDEYARQRREGKR